MTDHEIPVHVLVCPNCGCSSEAIIDPPPTQWAYDQACKALEKAKADNKRLLEEQSRVRQEAFQQFLDARHIEKSCPKCSGMGVRAYGSTATWAGGIGGQSITSGVCDKCWGSGDSTKPWASLRKMAAQGAENERLKEAQSKSS